MGLIIAIITVMSGTQFPKVIEPAHRNRCPVAPLLLLLLIPVIIIVLISCCCLAWWAFSSCKSLALTLPHAFHRRPFDCFPRNSPDCVQGFPMLSLGPINVLSRQCNLLNDFAEVSSQVFRWAQPITFFLNPWKGIIYY